MAKSEPRICAYCDDPIPDSRNALAMYCTKDCGQSAYRERHGKQVKKPYGPRKVKPKREEKWDDPVTYGPDEWHSVERVRRHFQLDYRPPAQPRARSLADAEAWQKKAENST